MFTGIIETVGTISGIKTHGQGKVLTIDADMDLSQCKIGDSIAVNGACLTAVTLQKNSFSVDMAPETVARTTFQKKVPGSRVNLERALRLSDRLDGHLVSGHIDGTGTILSIQKLSNAVILTIGVSEKLAGEMIEKGSVAIEGISLTINKVMDNAFELSIIPHTAKITTIGYMKVGDMVNIETDMLGKYVKRFLQAGAVSGTKPAGGGLSMDVLAKNGFL
ncbi:riboflavin synthase alpha chain [Desulfocicer vacuolatum DSM 3385]|uniref:Riboflavin synthase n=1 Tax=Desulfocicer vacuolatum DSM 3385 TaxID=1121400 RepID=A0A1W2C364_9BACT|nr:riboflavin synthase [Desulfocicer vacuolatum]SMC79342.1 riboflavin synthase alpha chain [Desulfocicer vacuolatum DSM 3385]